ncbi:ycf23 protein [Spatholobus suberectus]|nr:ycf23 protein [Spatholobus suberectus]
MQTTFFFSSHHSKAKPQPLAGCTCNCEAIFPTLEKKNLLYYQSHTLISSTRESVLKHFNERKSLKGSHEKLEFRKRKRREINIDQGVAMKYTILLHVLQVMGIREFGQRWDYLRPEEFNKDNVAFVITAADKGGATHVDIACDPDLVKLAISLTSCPILGLTKEARRILPSVVLLVTVPHTLSLPDQATPALAAAYSISQAVKIPVMCSLGLSAVTAPMAVTAGAAGVGVGSAVNRLNDVVAMIAEVRSIANSLQTSFQTCTTHEVETQRQ